MRQIPELFWISTERVEFGLKELSSQLMLRSPPTDWLTILFDLANNATDLLINFYLVNPRTFFAILLFLCYVLYYIRNVVHVSNQDLNSIDMIFLSNIETNVRMR